MTKSLAVTFALFAALICGMTPKFAAPQFGPTGYYEVAPAIFRTGTFLKAMDTNGDSIADLVVVTPGSTTISVLFGDGRGKFKGRLDSDIEGIVYAGGNAVEGDFNSDGHPDLVITMNKGPLRLMLGDGKGGFKGAPAFERVGTNPDCPGPLVAADVNHDGKLDVIASQCQGGIGIFLGDGHGAFTPALRVPVPDMIHSVDQSMAVADFNKDGTPDIAVATKTGVAILVGKGDGTFSEPVFLATGLPLKLCTADLNRDGNADLIVLPADPDLRAAPMFGAAGNSVNVYLGDGKGGFKALPPVPALLSGFTPDGGFPNHIEVADLNADGIPDLVITKQQYSYETDQTAAAVLFLAGRGDGTFAPPSEFRNPKDVRKYPRLTFALSDVNGDGKPDLIFLDDRSGTQIGVALNTSKTKSAGSL